MNYAKHIGCVVVVLVSLSGFALTETVNGVTWTYTTSNGEASLGIDSSSSPAVPSSTSGAIVIPSVLGGYSVTTLGAYAFRNCTRLMSVTVPNSVTRIQDSAFNGCSGLKEITLPFVGLQRGNRRKREALFGYIFGNSSYSGGIKMTQYCTETSNGSSFYIPSSLRRVVVTDETLLGYGAFSGLSGLTSIDVGDSVTGIEAEVFRGCSGLTDVVIPQCICTYGLPSVFPSAYTSITNVVISDGVTSIGDSAFYGCSGLTSVMIPNSVTDVGNNAFKGCDGLADEHGFVVVMGVLYDYIGNADNVTIPCVVASVSSDAFRNCSWVMRVVIPDSVTNIMDYAFSGCANLAGVTMPDSVTRIGNYLFYNCTNLTSMTICDGVMSIGEYAFANCSGLTSLTIPDGVTSIGDRAFFNCSGLTSVTIPNGVTSIGHAAFLDCSGLMSVTIPDSVTSIGVSVFSGCSGLTSVKIPNGVSSIGNSAFHNCSGLTCVKIPNGVMSIGDYAFSGCSGLSNVTIPDNITKIGSGAFEGTQFYANQTDGLVIFGKIVYKMKGECPAIVVIPDGVTSIGASAFSGCSGLTSVTIPDGVTSIEDSAFDGCRGLTNVAMPNSVTSIGRYAFRNCSGLTSVMIGNGVMSIRDFAFYNCSALTSVTIPNSVTSIVSSAFNGCNGLRDVTIPQYVCSRRLSSVFPSSYQTITNVVVSDGVTNIGQSVFRGCSGLTSVTIHESVAAIENLAFNGCDKLMGMTFYGNAPTIGVLLFGSSSPCTAYVRRSSTGWGVTIPGKWNGIAIDYVHYAVTMDANGGTCETPSLDVRDGTSVDALPIPTWGNAVFLGWFTEAEGGEQVQIVTAPTTLHAHWLTEVAKPIILSDHGSVFRSDSCEVSITCATDGAKIFYTDDGTTPKRYDDYLYAGPMTITDTTTFKAVAVVGGLRSAYTTVTITKHNLTLDEALNVSEGVVLATNPDLPWQPVYDAHAKLGDATARSCAIGNRTNTWFTATVSGAGTMSFWSKVSCEHDDEDIFTCDRLMVYTNGVEITAWRMDGETDWTQRTVTFADGENTVKWVYYKDKSDTGGEDCAWVDGIEWVPSAEAMLAAWLAERNLTAEARVANGRTAAECYALGLDPADATDDFRIVSIEIVDGEPKVEWEPKVNRWTGVEIQAVLKGAATLDGEWKSVEGTTAAEKAAMRFFKVVVEP